MRSPQRKRGAGAAWRLASALLISVHGAGFSREHRRALQASYTYANAADATPYCSLLDASICSGNPQRFLQVTANGPFEGIIVGSYSTWLSFAAPALVDLDNDGDMDLVSGDDSGTLLYFENTGTSTTPNFVPRTGTANPFDGFDVGSDSAPVFGDLDADGDMDVVVGEKDGKLNYFENTGTSTAPVFVQRTGSANLFDGFSIGGYSKPALGDLDNDGTLRPRPSIDKLRPHVFCLSQATWTSCWAMTMASSTTWRTPGRLRRRCLCKGPIAQTPSTASMLALTASPCSEISTATARSDCVCR